MKKKSRKRHREQGVITVFVTLMMVPVVAINGLMVDVARLKMYSSQAAMAADSYGDAVLSEFDNLLKQLYGLFSVTQNEEGLKAIEDLAKYASYSFNPNGDEKGFSGFMPYKDADMEVVYEKIDGASLSNNNVLATQISDFMKFRIVEEVMEEAGILSSLAQFDSLDADMGAMEERSKITDSSAEALGKIDEYYQELEKLAQYPAYLKDRDEAFTDYSNKLKDIVESEEYDDYVYYLEHRSEIEAIIEEFENSDEDEEDDNKNEDFSEEDDNKNEDFSEDIELYERFADFDPEEYAEDLKRELSPYSTKANLHSNDPIDFYNTAQIIDALGSKVDELEEILQTLDEQVNRLEEKIQDCSEDVKDGIEKEISELKDILAIADDFKETYELIAVVKNDKSLNEASRELMEEQVPVLESAKQDIIQGKAEPRMHPWPGRLSLLWYDFQDDKKGFYDQLKKLCGTKNGDHGDKDAGEKEINKANEAQKKAEEELSSDDEETTARDISDNLSLQLQTSSTSSGDVPNLTDYFSGGLSFKGLSSAGSNILDKFLVTSYDFGMFSSRVTGIKPKEEENNHEGSNDSEKEYADYSLTKIKMSPDVNYLYGAELEYLFGGHNRSVSNLNETRNIICGVRMTMNFASTYKIEEINAAIKAISDAAATAVGATGIGAAAVPLVRVAVSGALRMAVATIEMTADWASLKKREKVVLFKTELGDLQSVDAISSLLNIEIKKEAKDNKIKLSYEDYLYVLLVLLVDENTVLSRTSNLITLNVNQAMNNDNELIELKFKMADTVTAVKSTCKVRADFVIVPDNIAKMYYSNTNIESLIEVLEDNYFGYSVIRGY